MWTRSSWWNCLPDLSKVILAKVLNPCADGTVAYIPDCAIACDAKGIITYVGPNRGIPAPLSRLREHGYSGILIPPLLDAHIHIPQHPIRGKFMDGIGANPDVGRLLAGLNRNVFPAESRCENDEYTKLVVESFLTDTLAKGVVGGAAYMTVHPRAARIALQMLPETWLVGLVLMNTNCPPYLRTNEQTLEEDVRSLAEQFGNRLILTDRFAVSVDTPLRTRAVKLAEQYGLRMQTHLNEQIAEKRFVEQELYASYGSYTDVYRQDGELDRDAILAHCVRMSESEFDIVAQHGCPIAHCPTSNTLLGSGVMPLDEVIDRKIPYAICTDVGASPTVSLLAEMAQYLKVHATGSRRVTPSEALYRTTLAPAAFLRLQDQLGSFEPGKPLSFVEVDATFGPLLPRDPSPDETIQLGLLELTEQALTCYRDGAQARAVRALRDHGLDQGAELDGLEADTRLTCDQLAKKVVRVVLGGREVFLRELDSA